MGDRLRVQKPFWYVASHPGQLSLAIPLWVGTMSTSESWDVNRHTVRCTSIHGPWSRSVNWCLAEGSANGDECHRMGLMAREGLFWGFGFLL